MRRRCVRCLSGLGRGLRLRVLGMGVGRWGFTSFRHPRMTIRASAVGMQSRRWPLRYVERVNEQARNLKQETAVSVERIRSCS